MNRKYPFFKKSFYFCVEWQRLSEVAESLLLPLWHGQNDIITWMMSMKGCHYLLCGEVSQINKYTGIVFVVVILGKSLRTKSDSPKSSIKILSASLLNNSPQIIHLYFYFFFPSHLLFLFNGFFTLTL